MKTKYIRKYKDKITKEILLNRLFPNGIDDELTEKYSIIERYSSFKDYGFCTVRYFCVEKKIMLLYKRITKNKHGFIIDKKHENISFQL